MTPPAPPPASEPQEEPDLSIERIARILNWNDTDLDEFKLGQFRATAEDCDLNAQYNEDRGAAFRALARHLREREADKPAQRSLTEDDNVFLSGLKAESISPSPPEISTELGELNEYEKAAGKIKIKMPPGWSPLPSPPEAAANLERPPDHLAFRKLLDGLLSDANKLRMAGAHQEADEAMALLGLTATYCYHLADIPRTVEMWRNAAKWLEECYEDAHAQVKPEEQP